MNKNILVLIMLFVGTMGWSQYTIESVIHDNSIFCDGDFKTFIVKTVQPSGIAVTVGVNSMSDNGHLSLSSSGVADSTFLGGVSDTSYFTISSNTVGNIVGNGVDPAESFTLTLYDGQLTVHATHAVTDLVVYGYIFPTIDFTGVTICSNGQPIDLNQYATPQGGEFDWTIDVSNMFDPAAYYEVLGASGSIGYNYTNNDGCSGGNEVSFTLDVAPTVSMITTTTNCGQAQGEAVATVSGPAGPFDVYWSTGLLEQAVSSISTVGNLSSGVYYANITDAVGCQAVGVAQVSDADVVITDVITTETCNGMNDGIIDLTITASGNVTETFWSNGIETEDMTGHAGEYSIEVHTDNNCNAFGTYIIPGSNISFMLGNVNAADCFAGTLGSASVSASGGAGGLTYQWYNNTTATSWPSVQNLSSATAGVYTCTITDANLCQKSWDVTIPTISNAYVYTETVTKENCGASNGAVDVTLSFGTTTYWQWSNGAVTEDLINVPAGNYTLEYHDDGGCQNFLTVKVPNVKPYQPQICLLTVDTSLTYNEIVWEKDPNNIVDGFNIYRETTTFGEFELVTSQEYAIESKYIDNAASPVDRSWRYFITTYDACGESYGSFIHKTIHIVIESTDMVNYNLAWDEYEGIAYTSIDLNRYDNVNGWQTVINLPIGTNSYPDTPPVVDGLDYLISFNLQSPCVSTKAQDHNATRSNKTSASFQPGGDTDLTVIEKDGGKVMMYPNPTSDNLNIYIENYKNYDMIKILNINGELVYTNNISGNLNSISTANFAKGIYFVQIYSSNGIITEKIVKQ